MLRSRLSRYCQELRTGATTGSTRLMIGTDRISEPRYSEPKALPFQGAADSDPNSSAELGQPRAFLDGEPVALMDPVFRLPIEPTLG